MVVVEISAFDEDRRNTIYDAVRTCVLPGPLSPCRFSYACQLCCAACVCCNKADCYTRTAVVSSLPECTVDSLWHPLYSQVYFVHCLQQPLYTIKKIVILPVTPTLHHHIYCYTVCNTHCTSSCVLLNCLQQPLYTST